MCLLLFTPFGSLLGFRFGITCTCFQGVGKYWILRDAFMMYVNCTSAFLEMFLRMLFWIPSGRGLDGFVFRIMLYISQGVVYSVCGVCGFIVFNMLLVCSTKNRVSLMIYLLLRFVGLGKMSHEYLLFLLVCYGLGCLV